MSKNRGKFHSWKRNRDWRRLDRLKGCWVCGEDPYAHKFHSKEGIKNPLQKHKDNGTYVSVDDVVAVFIAEDDKNSGSESEVFSEFDDDQVKFVYSSENLDIITIKRRGRGKCIPGTKTIKHSFYSVVRVYHLEKVRNEKYAKYSEQ